MASKNDVVAYLRDKIVDSGYVKLFYYIFIQEILKKDKEKP